MGFALVAGDMAVTVDDGARRSQGGEEAVAAAVVSDEPWRERPRRGAPGGGPRDTWGGGP